MGFFNGLNQNPAAASNGLLTNLVSYWKLDEASGNALDAHGSNTLTANGAPGATTGKLSGCRTFNGSSDYFAVADNASLSTGDIDFFLAGWVYQTSAGNQVFAGKYDTGGTDAEYLLDGGGAAGTQYRFTVSAIGAAGVSVIASTFGNYSINTWNFLAAWHDSVANTINIQVNNGTIDSVSHSGGVFNSAAPFQFGARINGGPPGNFLAGRLDEFGFWKGGIPNSTQRGLLYGSGTPPGYSSFS